MSWAPDAVHTSVTLLPSLCRLLFWKPDAELDAAVSGPVLRASPAQFDAALEVLGPHKVLPLLCHQLERAGLLQRIPASAAERLRIKHAEVRRLNQMLFLSAASVLRAAAQRELQVCVLKGLLFADSYYPEPAARPMGDLDLMSPPGGAEVLAAALNEAGFTRVLDHVVQDHAVAYANVQGVACDAHAYLEMFPRADWHDGTREISFRRLHGIRARALESNLMLAHLVLHMHGHSRDLGFVLLWLLDVAFVLRRHAAELDAARLRTLIGDVGAWTLFLQVLGLLAAWGEALPVSVRGLVRGVPRLSLGAVLRARRTRPWGLPGPRGWARLLAHGLSLRDYAHRPTPHLLDLCLLPVDELTARVLPRVTRMRGWASSG